MAVLYIKREVDLLWGIWKMENSPGQGKRDSERIAVNSLLTELCGEEKLILHHESGQPYLSDHSYRISISHTGGYAAVVLHPSLDVGIDIEKIGEKVQRVRHKFLQPEEDANIVNGENEIVHLLLHWSAKETVYKVMGQEDVELKSHLCVSPFIPEEQGAFAVRELKTGTLQRFSVKYIVHPDFVLTYTIADFQK